MTDLENAIVRAVSDFGALKYFPKEPGAQTAIMSMLGRMVNNQRELEWLVTTMIDTVGVYTGTADIRAVYCSRFRPKDGVQAYLEAGHMLYRSEEQLEAEYKQRESEEAERRFEGFRIAAANQKLLTGEVATPAELDDLNAQLAKLAEKTAMPTPPQRQCAPKQFDAEELQARAEAARQRQIAENKAWIEKHGSAKHPAQQGAA